MAPTHPRDTLPRPTESESARPAEAPVVWPDPSPLDAWWQRVMHSDRPHRSVA
ncbi:hypothetical protein [Nocardia amamiensis]|uniref:hypothetical protein n=1 Tax=Nocardia TaxID=1817 RepID=UPI0033FD1084